MKEPASQCKCYSLHVPCMLIIGRCCWWEKCLKSQTKSHVCWLFFTLTTKQSSKLGIYGSPCSEATIRWILHSVPVIPSLMQCLNIINSLSQCKQTSITNIIFNLVNEFPPIHEALSWAAVLNPALNKINIRPQAGDSTATVINCFRVSGRLPVIKIITYTLSHDFWEGEVK